MTVQGIAATVKKPLDTFSRVTGIAGVLTGPSDSKVPQLNDLLKNDGNVIPANSEDIFKELSKPIPDTAVEPQDLPKDNTGR